MIVLTKEEYKELRFQFFPNKNKHISGGRLTGEINKRRPKHIRKENWETFTYTTRAKLIKDNDYKLLLEQQQKLFDEIVKNSQVE